MIQHAHIAFRTSSDIQSRLSAVANAEHLSVSDIVRRAALKTLRQLEKEQPASTKAKSDGGKKAETTKKSAPAKKTPKKNKPKSGGMFGSKRPKKTYEGEPGGKADWFLSDALDTIYDPHGTGKAVKGATILARSADGNVRVRDVIRAYALQGNDGISELAWTSPLTQYIIEAFDAC